MLTRFTLHVTKLTAERINVVEPDGTLRMAIFGDKGFIGERWQATLYDASGNRIWTARRANQHQQNSPAMALTC